MLDQINGDLTKVYNFKKDTNSIYYLRSISPVVRFNISDRYIKVWQQTTFSIPIERTIGLKYNGPKYYDVNPFLLNTQLYVSRNFSENVKMGVLFYSNFLFDNKFTYFTFSPRLVLNTVFYLPLTNKTGIYGLFESASTGSIDGILDSYYFKEGAGIRFRFNKTELNLYYSYVFLGKAVKAYNSFVMSVSPGF